MHVAYGYATSGWNYCWKSVVSYCAVVLKATLLSQDEAKRHLLEQQLQVQRLNALRDKTKPRSDKMEKLISQLKNDDLEILNSLLDRQTVVWIWCQSQTGLERLQKLNETNNLRPIDVFSDLTTLSTSSAEMTISKAVIICRDQFQKNAGKFSYALSKRMWKSLIKTLMRRLTASYKIKREIWVNIWQLQLTSIKIVIGEQGVWWTVFRNYQWLR